MADILESFKVSRDHIEIKFNFSVKVSSLINENFRLATTDATPVFFEDPFKTIKTHDHYNSITRILVLFFKEPTDLVTDNEYYFVISGNIKEANGTSIGDDRVYTFTYNHEHDLEPPPGSISTEFTIIDKSIKANISSLNGSGATGSSDFHVVRSDPDFNEIFIEEDHNNGAITVEFSDRPAIWFVDDKYFKVQRKRLISTERWHTLETSITMDKDRPIVYVYLPSVEDEGETSVYNTPDKKYFETGYKYRLRMSGEIGIP